MNSTSTLSRCRRPKISIRSNLDHILPPSEGHLRSVLAEFVSYYNQDRPHRALGLETPMRILGRPHGEVVSWPVLSGLHMSMSEPHNPERLIGG